MILFRDPNRKERGDNMFKKSGLWMLIAIVVVSLILLVDVTSSYAQEVDIDASFESGPLKGPFRKLTRGFLNLLFGGLEIGETVCEVGREEGVTAGATYGLLKGFCFAIARTVIGVYELVTFPIPIPADYEPILAEPEFYPGEGEGLK